MTPVRFLALGDSYTIGESVAEQKRWPVQLAGRLQEQGYQTEVTIIARTGWTTDELWEGIEAAPPTPPYDMVSLLIGVNNQYRGRDVEEYREQFIFLLNKAIEYTGGDPRRVIVVSIPDWGYTRFAANRDIEVVSREIDMFNAVNAQEAATAGVRYVDITLISRMGLDDFELIAGDGLHPSGKMYGLWVDLILPQALEILKP